MRKSYTLIEVLIVVLIISILAAVAVPNYLEFQTRAKYSRALADMRTISSALEAYNVDNNSYPMGIGEGVTLGIFTRDEAADDLKLVYFRLTTPVTYLTSIPVDSFSKKRNKISLNNGAVRKADQYFYETSNFPGNTTFFYTQMYELGFHWELHSWGPTGEGDTPFPVEMLGLGSVERVYDPTNGSTSAGFIIRTNKGLYPN